MLILIYTRLVHTQTRLSNSMIYYWIQISHIITTETYSVSSDEVYSKPNHTTEANSTVFKIVSSCIIVHRYKRLPTPHVPDDIILLQHAAELSLQVMNIIARYTH